MSGSAYNLEIFTPAGRMLSTEAEAVKLSTSDGEIGILPQHVTYTALLGTGVLEYTRGSETGRLVVSGGFCRYGKNSLSILADSVDLPEAVDRAGFAAERPKLEEILKTKNPIDPEWVDAERRLARIGAIERMLGR